MREIIKKYCYECGSKMHEHLIDLFNEESGKREIDMHCTNIECKIGCEFAGHKAGLFTLLTNLCERCGADIFCNGIDVF